MPGAASFAVFEKSRGRLAHRSIVLCGLPITRVAEQTVGIVEVPSDGYPQYPTGMTTLVYPHAN